LKGAGMNALTEFGKNIYTNVHQTFGTTCGDPVTSYQKGAMLVMGIVVDFKSHFDKTTFESKRSGKLTGFGSAAQHILVVLLSTSRR
jgi:hypothetical protein